MVWADRIALPMKIDNSVIICPSLEAQNTIDNMQ